MTPSATSAERADEAVLATHRIGLERNAADPRPASRYAPAPICAHEPTVAQPSSPRRPAPPTLTKLGISTAPDKGRAETMAALAREPAARKCSAVQPLELRGHLVHQFAFSPGAGDEANRSAGTTAAFTASSAIDGRAIRRRASRRPAPRPYRAASAPPRPPRGLRQPGGRRERLALVPGNLDGALQAVGHA